MSDNALPLNSMPGQKKDRVKTVQNEAGGLEGRRGTDKGNPTPSHTPLTEQDRRELYLGLGPSVYKELRRLRIPTVSPVLLHRHVWTGQFNGDGYRCDCGVVTTGKALTVARIRAILDPINREFAADLWGKRDCD